MERDLSYDISVLLANKYNYRKETQQKFTTSNGSVFFYGKNVDVKMLGSIQLLMHNVGQFDLILIKKKREVETPTNPKIKVSGDPRAGGEDEDITYLLEQKYSYTTAPLNEFNDHNDSVFFYEKNVDSTILSSIKDYIHVGHFDLILIKKKGKVDIPETEKPLVKFAQRDAYLKSIGQHPTQQDHGHPVHTKEGGKKNNKSKKRTKIMKRTRRRR